MKLTDKQHFWLDRIATVICVAFPVPIDLLELDERTEEDQIAIRDLEQTGLVRSIRWDLIEMNVYVITVAGREALHKRGQGKK